MARLFAALLCSLLLTACAGVQVTRATWPWSDPKKVCDATPCNSADATAVIAQALNYCRQVQNYYEAGGRVNDSGGFLIGVVGTLAGAVAAPLANGSAAKAWAGLSGATNGIQMSLEETFSASINAKRRAQVSTTVKDGLTSVNGGTDDAEKVNLAMGMATQCSMASGIADEATLKAINNRP